MKIIIERNQHGLNIDLGVPEWDHYEEIGMLEMVKNMIQKEIEKLAKNQLVNHNSQV